MYVNILFKKYNKQHTTLNYLTVIQLYTSTIQHSISFIPPHHHHHLLLKAFYTLNYIHISYIIIIPNPKTLHYFLYQTTHTPQPRFQTSSKPNHYVYHY